MTTEHINRAIDQFLAADRPDLGRLQYIRRLVELGRSIGRGQTIDREERERALLRIQDRQPHRAWNQSRLSEARLVLDCYRGYDEVVAHLEASGLPYTWHDFLTAMRKWRDGRKLPNPKQRDTNNFDVALSRLATAHGMSVRVIERARGRVIVTLAKRRSKKP